MSEYDYSPQAQYRFQRTQRRIADWANDAANYDDTPSPRPQEAADSYFPASPRRLYSQSHSTQRGSDTLQRSRTMVHSRPLDVDEKRTVARSNSVALSPLDSISQVAYNGSRSGGYRRRPRSRSRSPSHSHRRPHRSYTTGGHTHSHRHRSGSAAYQYISAPSSPMQYPPIPVAQTILPASPPAHGQTYVVYPGDSRRRVEFVYPQQPQPQPIHVVASPTLEFARSSSMATSTSSRRSFFSRIFGSRRRSRSDGVDHRYEY
ncbi:hypothetical protein C8F01DRAFT_1176541 [Mycena amicta]|nr:hypothetical protein C8F01DRAFT_1176541 [Mycena amicta]